MRRSFSCNVPCSLMFFILTQPGWDESCRVDRRHTDGHHVVRTRCHSNPRQHPTGRSAAGLQHRGTRRATQLQDVRSIWNFIVSFNLVVRRSKSASLIGEEAYSDVIMGAMASQITSLTIVYLTVYSGPDQRKHQSSASLAFVRGIHRSPVNSPHKWPVTWKMFPFDDVVMNEEIHDISGVF